MNLNEHFAACAHLRVVYLKIHNEDGTWRDRWECRDCKTEFRPARTLEAEVDRLREALERIAAMYPPTSLVTEAKDIARRALSPETPATSEAAAPLDTNSSDRSATTDLGQGMQPGGSQVVGSAAASGAATGEPRCVCGHGWSMHHNQARRCEFYHCECRNYDGPTPVAEPRHNAAKAFLDRYLGKNRLPRDLDELEQIVIWAMFDAAGSPVGEGGERREWVGWVEEWPPGKYGKPLALDMGREDGMGGHTDVEIWLRSFLGKRVRLTVEVLPGSSKEGK